VYTSALGQQSSYFTIRLNVDSAVPYAVPVAVHAFRSGTAGATRALLPDVIPTASGIYRVNLQTVYKFLSSTTTRGAISACETDFVSQTRALPVQVNNDTLFANGAPVKFDGVSVSENNFLLYPEITQATAGAVGASGMDDGTYSYIAIYETSDAQGNTARSTTSIPKTSTTSAGAGLGKVTLTTTQLNLTRLGWSTAKQTGSISYFRTTLAEPTVYRFVGQSTLDPTAASATYVDQAHDSTIGSNRLLYTGGGVIDREPPPPSIQMELHNGRVYGVSAADRKMAFYSGDVTPGEDVWFSNLQRFRVEPGGDLTALASLDDKLILFKRDRIFKVTGRGLNQLGQNSDLSFPQVVSSDCGCIDPRSVVATPDGVMFRGEKGIYLLNRSEQVSFIGANVDYYTTNYESCTSAIMVADRQEIRFTMTDAVPPLVEPAGVTLVYNYASDSWTTWTLVDGVEAISSIVAGSRWYWARDNGQVYVEDEIGFTDFTDASVFVPMTLETAWIQPSGEQGLARVNRVMMLGQSRSDHGLELQVAVNYEDVFSMDATWDAATLAALGLEQVAFHLPIQKGEAYRVRVNDYADGASPGEGFWTTGINLKAKPIRGAFDKLLAAGAKA